jgi:hypothetical protein
MQRNPLRRAILGALIANLAAVGAAHAVFLNPAGLGQVLVYPYYTVNGGNSTAITIVNTSLTGKAVKVRFLEAYNGRDVLDFNLYLSPHDVWVGQVTPVGTGAGLATNDNTCTVPRIPLTGAPLPFSTQAFDGSTAQGKDGGPTDASRTREGYVEVIDMGTVLNANQNTLDAITHSDGIPSGCQQVIDAWTAGGYWAVNASVDIGPPSGGLTGTGTLIDVALGTVEGYTPDALGQFYTAPAIGFHSAPDALTPNLSSATSLTSAAHAASPVSDDDIPIASTFQRSVDAVSSVFMADAVFNEYWTSGTIDAASEWVVTYPTKRFYTDPYYSSGASLNPFDIKFGPVSSLPQGAGSCAPVNTNPYDREEAEIEIFLGAPAPPNGAALCFATQVVTFNQSHQGGSALPSRVLGSALSQDYATPADNGWAVIDLAGASINHQLSASREGHVFLGLPVTGFWVTQFVNGNLGGVLANYTALYKHKLHVTCAIPASSQSSGSLGQACS